jgi:hypothetical protein
MLYLFFFNVQGFWIIFFSIYRTIRYTCFRCNTQNFKNRQLRTQLSRKRQRFRIYRKNKTYSICYELSEYQQKWQLFPDRIGPLKPFSKMLKLEKSYNSTFFSVQIKLAAWSLLSAISLCMILCWSMKSKTCGAEKIMPVVPPRVIPKNINRSRRSITIEIYFQSSLI